MSKRGACTYSPGSSGQSNVNKTSTCEIKLGYNSAALNHMPLTSELIYSHPDEPNPVGLPPHL